MVLRKVKASGGQIEMRMGMRATIQRVTSSTSLSSATVEEACTSNGQSRALGDPGSWPSGGTLVATAGRSSDNWCVWTLG